MDISKFLAKVMGIYLIIISLLMLIDSAKMKIMFMSLLDDPSLLFVTGFFTIILGILLVVSHNVWRLDWRLLITIFAWIVLIKGISLIVATDWMHQLTLVFIQNHTVYDIAGFFDLALGILLCYLGFKS